MTRGATCGIIAMHSRTGIILFYAMGSLPSFDAACHSTIWRSATIHYKVMYRRAALVLRYAAKVMYIRLSAFVTRPDIRETILNHRLIFECLIRGTALEWGGCTVKVHQHTLLDNAYQRKERSWQMPASRTYVVSLSAP